MKCSLILLSTLLFLQISGQEISYSLSNEITMRSSDEYQGLIRSDSSGYTLHIYERSGKGLLGYPGRNLILEKYDKDFNQVFSYAYGEDSKEPMITIELIAVGDYYIWIVMEKIREYKYEYSMIPISLDGKLGKKEFLFSNVVEKYGDLPQTYTRLSPDSSKVAFIATFDDNRKKESTEIFSTVIDEKANIVWDKFTKLRGNQKQHTVKDYEVSNAGDIYFVSKAYKDSKAKDKIKGRRGKDIAGYDITLYKVSREKRVEVQKVKLDLKGAFVSDAKLLLKANSDIFCAGLTTSKNKGNINGLFYASLDDNLTIEDEQIKLFTTKELIGFSRADADVNLKKKDKQGLDNDFKLTDIFYTADNSIHIITEQNYKRSYVDYGNNIGGIYGTNSGFNRRNNSTTIYSNDIVVISIDNNKVSDLDLISKKQNASLFYGNSFYNISEERERKLDYLLSYSHMVENGRPLFFYNEHKDNLDGGRNKNKTINNPRHMRSVIAFKSETSFERQIALPGNENKLLLSPTRSKQIGENQYFFTAIQSSSSNESVIRIGVISLN